MSALLIQQMPEAQKLILPPHIFVFLQIDCFSLVAQWLRCGAAEHEDAGSIPATVEALQM